MLAENNDIAVNQLQGLGVRSDATKPRILRNMKLTIENFSKIVQHEFELSNLTQANFAKKLGISTRTLQYVLKAEKTPDLKTVLSVLNELDYIVNIEKRIFLSK